MGDMSIFIVSKLNEVPLLLKDGKYISSVLMEPSSKSLKFTIQHKITRTAMMDHGASEHVEGQSHAEVTVKIENLETCQPAEYKNIELAVTAVKQESTINNNIYPIPCGVVKEEIIEEEWRGSLTPQDLMMPDPGMCCVLQPLQLGIHKDRLESIVRVQLKRLDASLLVKSCHNNKRQQQRASALADSQRSSKSIESQIYSCPKCVKTFTSETSFKNHCKYIHSTESHKCPECDKRFKLKAYLYKHATTVHSKQQYECAVCKEVFKSRKARNNHVLRIHRPGPAVVYTCDYCQKTYPRKDSLMFHIERAHDKVVHRCFECKRNFKFKNSLKRHVKIEHFKEEHECEFCKKIFRTRQYYNLHVSHCGKSARTSQYCISSPVVYKCDYCQKTYPRERSLVRHLEHVHEKFFHMCFECKIDFKCKSYLEGHMQTVHTNEKHECKFCKKIFRNKRYHNGHVSRVHGWNFAESHRQFTCSNCGKNFKTKSYWQKHESSCKCTHPTASNTSAVASTSAQQHSVVIVKEEPADGELDLGPVVFQHMDCNYRPYKQEPQLD